MQDLFERQNGRGSRLLVTYISLSLVALAGCFTDTNRDHLWSAVGLVAMASFGPGIYFSRKEYVKQRSPLIFICLAICCVIGLLFITTLSDAVVLSDEDNGSGVRLF